MSKRKLLLADDSVTIQKVVNLTFADEGFDVIAVGDGDSAMEKLADMTPDLVLADVNMPGLNGYQVCEKIKQDVRLRHTPVILLVGSFEPYDEQEAKRVGADDFLTKPFQSIRQLVNKVNDLLDADRDEVSGDQLPEPAPSDFDETLRMGGFEEIEVEGRAVEFDHGGADDEMIQTSQANSFVFEESQRFETRDTSQPAEDFAQTQPLTPEEIKEFDLTHSADDNLEEVPSQTSRIEVSLGEPIESLAEYSSGKIELPTEVAAEEDELTAEDLGEAADESKAEIEEETIPMPEAASILHLDEFNPLELPPIEFDGEAEAREIVSGSDGKAGATPKTDAEQQISDELIEAVTRKVLERLSEKAVTEVAWEVVPELTELIVKKMAEDIMKDSK